MGSDYELLNSTSNKIFFEPVECLNFKLELHCLLIMENTCVLVCGGGKPCPTDTCFDLVQK